MARMGDGILFIAMGAILAFGFNLDLGVVRLDVIGWIIMAAGAAFAVLGYLAQMRAERELREAHEDPARTEPEGQPETGHTL